MITVAVISYNSSKTILETLESILDQSYGSKNIELIISDDGSSDDTVKIIENWLSKNYVYFYSTKLIQNEINKGVSKNINNAWKSATCNWIKTIAADDVLDNKCLQLNFDYVNKNPQCKIVFSKMEMIGSRSGILPTPFELLLFNKDSYQQYIWLKNFSFNIAPTSFISNKLLKEVGYADEKYKMIEDLPLWLKITKKGYKLHFFDSITVYYRVNESITISKNNFINRQFIKDLRQIYKDNSSSNLLYEVIRYENIFYYNYLLKISDKYDNTKKPTTTALYHAAWLFRPIHFVERIVVKSYNKFSSIKSN